MEAVVIFLVVALSLVAVVYYANRHRSDHLASLGGDSDSSTFLGTAVLGDGSDSSPHGHNSHGHHTDAGSHVDTGHFDGGHVDVSSHH